MTVQVQPAPRKKDRSTTYLLVIAGLVAIAGIAFAVGRLTAPATAAAANGNGRFGNGAFARASGATGVGAAGRGFGISGGIEGTVQSISGTTMTIQLANGNTVTVDLASGTTYQSTTTASQSQVAAGSKVLVTIDTAASGTGAGNGGTQPAAGASGAPGAFNRTFTAKNVILETP